MAHLKVFTCNDFVGHYPIGTAAIIVAENKARAHRLLMVELASRGLDKQQAFTVQEVSLTAPSAIILRDGDY